LVHLEQNEMPISYPLDMVEVVKVCAYP